LPDFKSNRARRGVVGAKGFFVVSKTATLILTKKAFDFDATSLLRNVRLDNDHCGLFACDTSFAFVACLITSLRAWDWQRIPR
jgi:hypothetical protein